MSMSAVRAAIVAGLGNKATLDKATMVYRRVENVEMQRLDIRVRLNATRELHELSELLPPRADLVTEARRIASTFAEAH